MILFQNLVDDFNQDILEIDNCKEDDGFNKVNSTECAETGDLTYCLNKKFLKPALEGPAKALVLTPDQKEFVSDTDKVLIFTPLPELLIAKILFKYFYNKPSFIKRKNAQSYISETAIVSPQAKIAEDVIIEDYAIIKDGATIASGCYIGPHALVEENASLGPGSELGPQVILGSGVKVGQDCVFQAQSLIGASGGKHFSDEKWHQVVAEGKLVLGDRIETGAQCYLEQGLFGTTTIGNGTKLDNQVSVLADTHIGQNCMLTACVSVHESCNIGDFCAFGGNTTVLAGVSITAKCQFAGVSRVAEDIDEPGVYGGEALQPLKDYLRTLSVLPKLPEINKSYKKLSRDATTS